MTHPPRRPPRRSSQDEGGVVTVGELVRTVSRHLEATWPEVQVEGEISEVFLARSGHVYLTLRDQKEDAVLRGVMWASSARRLRFEPATGKLVRATGTLTIYSPRGDFQIRISRLEESGQGELRRRFEETLARLTSQGLLAQERKRPLPVTPRRLGVVTSRDGAALRDIIKVLGDRLPLTVVLAHTAVQGEAAPAEIVEALRRLTELTSVEVVIVGRGGGSAEDLAAWNDERVALAVASCPVPVISAVGHETDVSITDLVADRRAATPSEAAMLACPGVPDLARHLAHLGSRLARASTVDLRQRRSRVETLTGKLPASERVLDTRRQKVDELAHRAEVAVAGRVAREVRSRHALELRLERHHPEATLGRRRQDLGRLVRAAEHSITRRLAQAVQHAHRVEARLARLDPAPDLARRKAAVASLASRLGRWPETGLAERRARLGRGAARLEALSPLRVLSRGYALVRKARDGGLVTDAGLVDPGDLVEVRLSRGHMDCEVRSTRPDDGLERSR
jgi:exodeoxyribonuclease VII large subunit